MQLTLRGLLSSAGLAVLIGVVLLAVPTCQGSHGDKAASVTAGAPAEVRTSREQASLPGGVAAPGADAYVVKPLDDPGNPYAGMYEEWDVWVFANLDRSRIGTLQYIGDTATREDCAPCVEDPDAAEIFIQLCTQITSDGYVTPVLEIARLYEDAVAIGPESVVAREAVENWVATAGMMPMDLWKRQQTAAKRQRAARYMPVPDWLMLDIPEETVLPPNGDVITNRPVAGGRNSDAPSADEGITNFRYNADGELLGWTNDFWYSFYYKERNATPRRGYTENLQDGTVEEFDPDTGELIGRWNWDGTRLPLTAPDRGHANDRHHFQFLFPGFVKLIHEYR